MKQTAVAALGIFGPKTVFVQVKEVKTAVSTIVLLLY